MKKLTLVLFSVVCLLTLHNCSSVKVVDSWKSDNVSSVKNNNFLVVARTTDNQARLAFENEIVKQMQARGFKATASFSKFGNMSPNDENSEANREKLKAILKAEGFDGVILTVMKDLEQETRIDRDGGYYAGGNYYGYYPRYYGGFYGYYGHPMAYSTLGNYVPETTTTRTSKIYVLETTAYDLTAKDEETQLVAVVTSKIDNPDSATEAASEYVKKIISSLK